MRINTNVSAINAYRNLTETNSSVSKSMEKLSSGFRINRAADDAAGLGIANKFRADSRAMTMAARNGEQANSVLQITEGAVASIQDMLERMKELATQAGSDSVDDAGRTKLNQEFVALRDEIQRTVDTTKFQGKKLLDNSFGNSVDVANTGALASGKAFNDVKISGAGAGLYTLSNTGNGVLSLTNGTITQTAAAGVDGRQTVSFSQFGITVETGVSYDKDATAASQSGTISIAQGSGGGSFLVSSSADYTGQDKIDLSAMDLRATAATGLNLGSIDLTTVANARTTLTRVDTAMTTVGSTLGSIGAAQNRIEYAMSNLKTAIQNYAAAESVIRDVDMAEEMTKFSKNQILAQAGTAMLAQANQSSQGVLQLLRS
jgi:flagellin